MRLSLPAADIAAVSDGHGDSECFRSDRGARYACEAALSVLEEFAVDSSSARARLEYDEAGEVRLLEGKIVEKWLELVHRDLTLDPMPVCSASRETIAYGCTLIAVLRTEGFWLGIQIGDGSCVAVLENGEYRQPIPRDDERCVFNYVTSLCDAKAADEFRHFFCEAMPLALFLVTDGVDDSFDEYGLYYCCYTIACWMQNASSEETLKRVEDLLPTISRGGSRDDVSVAAIVRQGLKIAKPSDDFRKDVLCLC
jgi:hypothetical protein